MELKTEKNPFKGVLIGFGILVIAGFLLVAALVVYVDPFFHYHSPLEGFPYQVDNQREKHKHTPYDECRNRARLHKLCNPDHKCHDQHNKCNDNGCHETNYRHKHLAGLWVEVIHSSLSISLRLLIVAMATNLLTLLLYIVTNLVAKFRT